MAKNESRSMITWHVLTYVIFFCERQVSKYINKKDMTYTFIFNANFLLYFWNQMDQKNGQKLSNGKRWKLINNYVTHFDVIFFCFGTLTSYLNKKERWLTHSFSMPIFFSIFGIKWTKEMAKKLSNGKDESRSIYRPCRAATREKFLLSKINLCHLSWSCQNFNLITILSNVTNLVWFFSKNFTGEVFFYF